MLTIFERYNLLANTIGKCSSNIVNERDDIFMHIVFSELPIEMCSFLHESNLDELEHYGYIDAEIHGYCDILRDSYYKVELVFEEVRNAQELKKSDELRLLTSIADIILEKLYI